MSFSLSEQRLLYVVDPLAERVFFIELSEIITGKDLGKAVCSRKAGEAPKQTVDYDEMTAKSNSGNLDIDENFYGDQDFDMEDFDPEGFEMCIRDRSYIKENYPDQFIIADAKRGDIGNTSAMYARTFFEELDIDSVTVAPYMGEDSVTPFLSYEGKWVIPVSYTHLYLPATM